MRGAKTARPGWWQDEPKAPRTPPRPASDNPFARPASEAGEFNPFVGAQGSAADPFAAEDDPVVPEFNPFAPAPAVDPDAVRQDAPTKLRLLDRGRAVFGSYAKVLLLEGEPAAYAQFGPLSAYPRAQHIREFYPRLPSAPLPAVITCIAVAAHARGQGLGRNLVAAVAEDLGERGFAAVEAYPDLTLQPDEASAADPTFWIGCGFELVVEDERYPVMRLELG